MFALDFGTMRVCDLEFDCVRRLSTPPSPLPLPATNPNPTPSCHTVWKYYCRDNFGWREYSEVSHSVHLCVCSGVFRLYEQDARHISFAHINQLSSDGVDLEKKLSCTQTTCFCNTAFYPCVTFYLSFFTMATFDLQVKWKNAEVTCRKW